jgi:hypothetical protein
MEEKEKGEKSKRGRKETGSGKWRVVAIVEKASWRFEDHVGSLTNSRVIHNSTLQDSP